MSVCLSAAPERPWNPMSKVPPSPPQAITRVSLSPWVSRAALSPAAAAAADRKGVWRRGTSREKKGWAPAMMDQQDAGMTTMVFGPRALRARRMDGAAPQPGQAGCPGLKSSSRGMSIIAWPPRVLRSISFLPLPWLSSRPLPWRRGWGLCPPALPSSPPPGVDGKDHRGPSLPPG